MSRLSLSPFSIIISFVILAIIGLAATPRLTFRLFPIAGDSKFYVSFSWADSSPRAVEQEVTSRLEAIFSSIHGLKSISSVSSKGGGSITLQFKKDVGKDQLRYEIAGLLRQCYKDLPPGVTYPSISDVEGKQMQPALLSIGLTTKSKSQDLGNYIREHLIPSLLTIEGVRETTVTGVATDIVDISFSAEKAVALHLRGEEIASAVKTFLHRLPVGKVYYEHSGGNVSEIQVDLNFVPGDSINWHMVPIRNQDGRIIYLGDVATTRVREQPPTSYFRLNGLPTIMVSVDADESANSLRVSREIKKMLAGGLIPGTFAFIVLNDQSEYLQTQLEKIASCGAVSLIVVLFFVLIFKRRSLLIIGVMLGVVIFIAVIPVVIFHIQLNSYSAIAVVVGIAFIIFFSLSCFLLCRRHVFASRVSSLTVSSIPVVVVPALVFLFTEGKRIHFEDFCLLLMTIVATTILAANLLVPALEKEFMKVSDQSVIIFRRKRFIMMSQNWYRRFLVTAYNWRFVLVLILILSFGIPLHLLPEKLDGSDQASLLYNRTLGNSVFTLKLKSQLSKIFGGTFRLFSEQVFANSYVSSPGKTTLYVTGRMPEGCTILQMTEAIREMENFISQFEEVQLFQSTITSYKSAFIKIEFSSPHEQSGFPLKLKSQLEWKAIDLGGASWNVYGIGIAFSNAAFAGFKSNRIILEGYNYEELFQYAEQLREQVSKHPRVADAEVLTSDKSIEGPANEFYFSFNDQLLASVNVSKKDFFGQVNEHGLQHRIANVPIGGALTPVDFHSDKYTMFDMWDFNNTIVTTPSGAIKVGEAGTVVKRPTGTDITKYDQQYRMVLVYDFVGPVTLGKKLEERFVKAFEHKLPLGFSVHGERNALLRVGPAPTLSWDKDDDSQYYILLLAVVVIYFICAVTFESLLQPFIVITMIPISFTGCFVAFLVSNGNFDDGGFMGAILLSALASTGAILIVNEYNLHASISRQNSSRQLVKAVMAQFEGAVILPICISLSVLPFLISGQREAFWYSFSTAVLGGELFSLVGLYIFLPVFLRMQNRNSVSA